MLSRNKRNSVIILGLLFIIVIAIGASRDSKKEPVDEVDISFKESDLDDLGESIKGLEFDDLGGLNETGSNGVEFSVEDLDNLGEALKRLKFEDLEGLTEN